MKSMRAFLAASGLLLSLACGGGGGGGGTVNPPGPTVAASLSYTDPTISGAGNHYWLRRNASLSTPTHLVLDVVTDDAGTGNGIAFELNADAARVAWARVQSSDTALTQNGNTFVSGPTPVVVGRAASGRLSAAVSQKGLANPQDMRAANGKVLARVALDLATGVAPGPVSLSQVANKASVLYSSGTVATITLTPGILTAN